MLEGACRGVEVCSLPKLRRGDDDLVGHLAAEHTSAGRGILGLHCVPALSDASPAVCQRSASSGEHSLL